MSPLQRQLLPIQIGGGLDTKSDPKKVVSSKLLSLENGIFTNPGEIEKRNGYQALPLAISGGGTITSPKAIKAYKDELVCAAENSNTPGQRRLFSFSSQMNTWVDKGKYDPYKVSAELSFNDINITGTTSEQRGSIVVIVGTRVLTSTTADLYVVVKDTEENVKITEELLLVQSSKVLNSGNFGIVAPVYVCSLTATSFGIFYLNSANHLSMKILTVTTTVTIGNEIVLQTDVSTSDVKFAAHSIPSGAVVIYSQTTSGGHTPVTIFTVDTAGSITHTAVVSSTLVSTSGVAEYYLDVDSDNQIWAYVLDFFSSHLTVAVYSTVLATILAPTTNSSVSVGNLCAYNSATNAETIFYTDANTFLIYSMTVNTAGTFGTPASVSGLLSAIILSRPIVIGSTVYIVLLGSAYNQSVYILLDTYDGNVVAQFQSGFAGSHIFLPQATPFISGSKFSLSLVHQEAPVIDFGTATVPFSSALVTLDGGDPDLYQAIEVTDSLIWNGGLVTQYDGLSAVELGFITYPTRPSLSPHLSGGSMADGTYGYRVVYQWLDNNGRMHQSAPSVPVSTTISGGGGAGSATLTTSVNIYTLKKSPRFPVQVAIFRTEANGTNYFQITSPTAPITVPDSGVLNITYVDTASDVTISTKPALYTTGEVVDNIVPPPAVQMTIYNSRLWIVPSEDASTVWYSKTVTPGVGLSFSDLLTANVDQRQGDITGLAGMDDKIVFFKRTVPFFSVGDGANDVGTGSSLSLPQLVASDAGCIASKSILLNMPSGILFQSEKGIYAMDRSLQVQYIGKDVEAYNAQTITSAVMVNTKSQIRFLCSDGVELVYDYIYGQWSTFTNHLGNGADIWQDNYTYCRVDGDIYNETPAVYVDKAAAISLKPGTAWIKLADIQNFQRIWGLWIIGDWKSAHYLKIDLYKDFEATPYDTIQLDNTIQQSGAYQWRIHLPIQKCESVKFVVYDDFTGLSAGEGFRLSELSLEVGLKQGLYKLPPSKTAG